MFLVEIVTFMVAWPILWWLGGRLDRAARQQPAPQLRAGKVVDLAAFRQRKEEAARRRVSRPR
jgi:hypothetical protein